MFTCLRHSADKTKERASLSVAAATEAAATIQTLGYALTFASQPFTDVPAIRIRWTIILALQLSDVLDIRI